MNTVVLSAMVMVLTSATVIAAQTNSPPAVGEKQLLVGPVALSPAIALKDIGVDSNVFGVADNPKQDFTSTFQPHLGAAIPFGPMRFTGATTVGFVYYATYKDQQSINWRYDARLETTTTRVHPFVAAAINRARERPDYEIDARVLSQNTSILAGAQFQLTSVTSLNGSYRRITEKFGDNEQFLGIALAPQLNQASDVASAGAKWAVTPLTTLSIDVQRQRDRFESSSIRNADTIRVMPTAQFAPDAVITGSIAAGFLDFSPRDPSLPAFRGLAGAVKVAGAFFGATRVSVEATRDVMPSFDPVHPYFLVDSAHVTVSQPIRGPFDVVGLTGIDRLRYDAVEGLPFPPRVDRVRTVGGGLGFRVNPSLRLTVIYDFARRSSQFNDFSTQFNDFSYDRRRLFASVTYQ